MLFDRTSFLWIKASHYIWRQCKIREKANHLQVIHNTCQFWGYLGEDPRPNQKLLLYICFISYVRHITKGALFTHFLLTLRDEVKKWASSLETGEVRTWKQFDQKIHKRSSSHPTKMLEDKGTSWTSNRLIERTCMMHGTGINDWRHALIMAYLNVYW